MKQRGQEHKGEKLIAFSFRGIQGASGELARRGLGSPRMSSRGMSNLKNISGLNMNNKKRGYDSSVLAYFMHKLTFNSFTSKWGGAHCALGFCLVAS